ncbi:MAG: hypothetical protein AB2A00_14305 [Myxococcota bacterium]
MRLVRILTVLAGVLSVAVSWGLDFRARQDAAPRVVTARKNRTQAIQQAFSDAKVAYPPAAIYLRAFKQEGVLELWAGEKRDGALTFIKAYSICQKSGVLGPKRREGDLQVPEGFYEVDRFNPHSNFHLSLGLNYPNASDRIRSDKHRPGGDVFIHGDCVTIGCLPIENDPIEELYVIALDTRLHGGKSIPVHVFPRRMDEAGMEELRRHAGANQALVAFWEELQPGFVAFERDRRVPRVSVEKGTGRYRITPGG